MNGSQRSMDDLSTLPCVNEDVVVVIPTFRPPERTRQLIDTLRPMVGALVVADDASPCTFDPFFRECQSLSSVKVYRFARNAGIARSLNIGWRTAQRIGAPWLLTVDQDSALPHRYVADLVAAARGATHAGVHVGVIGPATIQDSSGPITYPVKDVNGWPTTAEVFQTGALWSVHALSAINGFDESFVTDAVDAEACLSLREAGYHVALALNVTLAHSWGEARQFKVLGTTIAATGHSPHRRTHMVRNRMRLAPREFRQSPTQAVRSLRRLTVNTLLAVSVEQNRWAKARASVLGLIPRSGPTSDSGD
jgi:rhamnosyltransferase